MVTPTDMKDLAATIARCDEGLGNGMAAILSS
jgi:hypothetical protein